MSTQLARRTRPERCVHIGLNATSGPFDNLCDQFRLRRMSPLSATGDTDDVGFNPHRQQRRSPLDYVMVAAALATCLGLVLWALFA